MERDELDKILYLAYLDARYNERSSKSQLEFEMNLELNLRNLREDIYNRRYKLSPSFCFIITHPSKREVFAPSFRDRVVSHFVYNILYSIIDPLFIYDSYSCRVGKGTLFGILRFHHHLRASTDNFTKKSYVLCLDISGYFMNINKNILLKLVIDMIESRRGKVNIDFNLIEYLIDVIINNDTLSGCIKLGNPKDWLGLPSHKSLFNVPSHKGLPIGALTSLLFSNIYLNALDQFVKRKLKCKYYCRYVDDARIISDSKEYLESIIPVIRKFLQDTLDLELNLSKTKIISSYKRLEFLGAVILCLKLYATSRTLKNFAQRVRLTEFSSGVRAIQSLLNSSLGYLAHFRADKTITRVLKGSDLPKLFYFTNKANIIRFMIKTLIWGWEPPKYERYESGLYRILFNPQPFEETITHIDQETGEEITLTVTRYRVWCVEKDLPNLTKALNEKNYLEAERIVTLELIEAYDISDAVNQFSIGDNQIWLDKSMRVGLNNSISKEMEVGREETTLWYDMSSFTIPCQTAMQMLTLLEMYALQCYNVTAQHKVKVKNAETLDQLKNYDYRAGYPEKLHFNI